MNQTLPSLGTCKDAAEKQQELQDRNPNQLKPWVTEINRCRWKMIKDVKNIASLLRKSVFTMDLRFLQSRLTI